MLIGVVKNMQLKIRQNLKDPKINTKFLKIISLAYQKTLKHLRWSVLPLTIFAKCSILDVWHGSEYAPAYNEEFSHRKCPELSRPISKYKRNFFKVYQQIFIMKHVKNQTLLNYLLPLEPRIGKYWLGFSLIQVDFCFGK